MRLLDNYMHPYVDGRWRGHSVGALSSENVSRHTEAPAPPCSGATPTLHPSPMKRLVILLGILLVVLHQDFWFWDDATLVFGFLPVGLAYHAGFSVARRPVLGARLARVADRRSRSGRTGPRRAGDRPTESAAAAGKEIADVTPSDRHRRLPRRCCSGSASSANALPRAPAPTTSWSAARSARSCC